MLLDLFVKVRLVLESVGIDFLAFQRFIWLVVIVEGHALDDEAVFLAFFGNNFPDVFIFAAHDADLDGLVFCMAWRACKTNGESCSGEEGSFQTRAAGQRIAGKD